MKPDPNNPMSTERQESGIGLLLDATFTIAAVSTMWALIDHLLEVELLKPLLPGSAAIFCVVVVVMVAFRSLSGYVKGIVVQQRKPSDNIK